MHSVLVLKNCVCFSNFYLINDWRHFVPFIVNVFYFTKPTMSPSLKLHFFCVMRESFFRLGNVPLRVISGHPLLKSNSTSSLAPAVLAYDTADLPSWSIALTFALDQIKSCTNARLPSEDAKCNGDLASLGLTEEFTSSALQ